MCAPIVVNLTLGNRDCRLSAGGCVPLAFLSSFVLRPWRAEDVVVAASVREAAVQVLAARL